MAQFLIALLFFMLALALFWGVLHWVRYKKRPGACTCGKGACLTDSGRFGHGKRNPDPGAACDPGGCRCEERSESDLEKPTRQEEKR